MRTLVVTSYPPERCGIGRYALQQVESLTSEGHDVKVMSLSGQGCVDYRIDFARWRDGVAALGIFPQFDRIIVNYAPGILPGSGFGPLAKARWAGFYLTLIAAFYRFPEKVSVIVHETLPMTGLEGRLQRAFWRAAPSLVFHTQAERNVFLERYPFVDEKRCELALHEQHFTKYYHGTQEEARATLGITPEQVVFLSCGFIQSHKGFDRVVAIFDEAKLNEKAHYYVVGSLRVEDPKLRRYCEDLKQQAKLTRNATVIESFLDDEAFDRWIVAADYVVIPYREIWSSGIVARAKIFGRRVIASQVGGLKEQLSKDDALVEDDAALMAAIVERSSTRATYRAEQSKTKRRASRLRIAFCIARFGENVVGGAETAVKQEAQQLQKRGHAVEVWTTTTDSMDRFNSNFAEGVSEEAGLVVRRFASNAQLWLLFSPLHARMHRPHPPRVLQWAWNRTNIDSPQLHSHIRQHAQDFDAMIFAQSLFGTTQNGSRIAPRKSLLQPCLHDEPPAALDPIQTAWRQAAGILYFTNAEKRVAHAKGLFNPREAVVGGGIDATPRGQAQRFAEKFGITQPYLLFVGKLSALKNLPELLEGFAYWQRLGGTGVNLLLCGTGDYQLPVPSPGVRILKNLSQEDKTDAMAGALALVQPSLLESFSLVILEAWQQGRPVIVHSRCAPTLDHARDSNAGLWFDNPRTFAKVLDYLVRNPEVATGLGARGARYVDLQYSWDAVCDRMLGAIDEFVVGRNAARIESMKPSENYGEA